MADTLLNPLLGTVPRRVLLIVEDSTLGELLAEALADAGHESRQVDDVETVVIEVAAGSFDAAIVDLDTRARNGAALVERLRAVAPSVTVIALLPCGGLSGAHSIPYHLSIEKPARLQAVLSAVNAARTRN